MINLQRPLTCPFWLMTLSLPGAGTTHFLGRGYLYNGYGYEVGSGSGWGYTDGSGFGLYPDYAILELSHVAT